MFKAYVEACNVEKNPHSWYWLQTYEDRNEERVEELAYDHILSEIIADHREGCGGKYTYRVHKVFVEEEG